MGLFPFFKNRLSADEAGAGLLQLAIGSEEAESHTLERLPADLDRQRIRSELLYLRLCAVDFGIYNTYGDRPAREALLDGYHTHLREMAGQGPSFPVSYDEFMRRLLVYGQAVSTPHQSGPGWTVGVAFAKLCGTEMDIDLISQAAIHFGVVASGVSDCLKGFRIV